MHTGKLSDLQNVALSRISVYKSEIHQNFDGINAKTLEQKIFLII